MRERYWVASLVLLWAAVAVNAGQVPSSPNGRGMTYESLKDLPPLAGMWGAAPGGRGGGPGGGAPGARGGNAPPAAQNGPPNAARMLTDIPPLRDQQVLARYKEAITLLVSGADNVELAAKYGDVLQGRGGSGTVWRELGGGLCDPYGGSGPFGGRTGGGPETVMEILSGGAS